MKKGLLLTLALGLGLTLASCSKAQSYDGKDVQKSYGNEYVTEVKVSVKDGVIVSVELAEGAKYATSAEVWKTRPADIEALAKEYCKKFEGKKVEDILALDASAKDKSTFDKFAGATDSGVRIQRAVQDALKKIEK